MRNLLFVLICVFALEIPAPAQDMAGFDEAIVAADTVSNSVKTGSQEQQGVRMSLRECLEVGLVRNFDILIERNLQQESDNNATYGNAGGLPTIGLSGSYSGTLNNTKQELASGGSVTNNGIHNATVNAGVNLTWTVFDGFNVRTTYDRLLELQKIGELNTRLTVENFITTFTTQYYNYIRQYIRLNNLRSAVRLSRERVRIVETHYTVGTMSGLDLQQARVDLNSDRSALLLQYETMHSVRTLLNQLLASDDIEFPIIAGDSVIEFNSSLTHDEILGRLIENNTYLELARRDEQVSTLDLKLAKSGRYPYLRLNSGYGYTHNWYGSSTYDRQRNLGLNYGVTLGVNIFDGSNQKRRERNVRLQIENKELAYAETELGLRKSLSDTWMAYRNNMRLIELEQDNLSTARLLYETAIERYRLGQLSGIELREAQNSLLAAEERLVQAEFDTKLSEITLMNISGQSAVFLEE